MKRKSIAAALALAAGALVGPVVHDSGYRRPEPAEPAFWSDQRHNPLRNRARKLKREVGARQTKKAAKANRRGR